LWRMFMTLIKLYLQFFDVFYTLYWLDCCFIYF
jgi:hypothetical protein